MSWLVRFRIEIFFGAFLLGSAAGAYAPVSFFVWLVIVGAVIVSAYSVIFRGHSAAVIVSLCVLALSVGGIRAATTHAEAKPRGKNQPIAAGIRDAVSRTLENNFSRPESDVLAGILIGAQGSMPQSVVQSFRRSGLSHILVVSGEHISLALFFFGTLLSGFGINRKKRWPILIIAGAAYTIVTGLSASAIRAALMGTFGVLAQQFGRTSSAIRALLLSASALVFLSPPILLSDLSFQLSFSATAGLILFSKPIESYLSRLVPASTIRSLLSQTFAAIIATQPLIFSAFGTASIVSPIANLFAAPLVPLVMGFGAVWGMLALGEALIRVYVGVLPISVAALAAMPAWGATHVLIGVSDAFARLPFAQVAVTAGMPLAVATGASLWLAGFLLLQSKKKGAP